MKFIVKEMTYVPGDRKLTIGFEAVDVEGVALFPKLQLKLVPLAGVNTILLLMQRLPEKVKLVVIGTTDTMTSSELLQPEADVTVK